MQSISYPFVTWRALDQGGTKIWGNEGFFGKKRYKQPTSLNFKMLSPLKSREDDFDGKMLQLLPRQKGLIIFLTPKHLAMTEADTFLIH